MYKQFLTDLISGIHDAVISDDEKAFRECMQKVTFVAGVHFGSKAVDEFIESSKVAPDETATD